MGRGLICTIEEYYQRRKNEYIEEAKAYARSISERFNRMPVPSDFAEEFPLFCKKDEFPTGIKIRKQLGDTCGHYRAFHMPHYNSFEEFINDAFSKTSKT